MGRTLFWVLLVPSTIVILLLLGYKAWRRNRSSVLSRHSQTGSLTDEQTRIWPTQEVGSADKWAGAIPSHRAYSANTQMPVEPSVRVNSADAKTIQSQSSPRISSADAKTQVGHSHKVDQANAKTQVGHSPKPNPTDDAKTQVGHSHTVDPADEQTQIRRFQKEEPVDDDRTQIGRNLNDTVNSDDNRTIL